MPRQRKGYTHTDTVLYRPDGKGEWTQVSLQHPRKATVRADVRRDAHAVLQVFTGTDAEQFRESFPTRFHCSEVATRKRAIHFAF